MIEAPWLVNGGHGASLKSTMWSEAKNRRQLACLRRWGNLSRPWIVASSITHRHLHHHELLGLLQRRPGTVHHVRIDPARQLRAAAVCAACRVACAQYIMIRTEYTMSVSIG
jgi:hypothetical protein